MSACRARTVGPVLALLLLAVLRCQAEPIPSVPPEAEMADLLADLGEVRAASTILGDEHAALPADVADSWNAVAHYVVTTPDRPAIWVSIAVATLRSEMDAQAFSRAFAARHRSTAAAPVALVSRGRTESGVDADEVHAFRMADRNMNARLTRLGRSVWLILARTDPNTGGSERAEVISALLVHRLAAPSPDPSAFRWVAGRS